MFVKHSNKLFLAAAVIILLNFSSCKKYGEDSGLQLKSPTKRLIGEWELDKITDDQGNVELGGNDFELIAEFEDDMDFKYKVSYSYTYYGVTYNYDYTYNGEWEWEDDEETIEIKFDSYSMEWEVKKLSDGELWVEDEDNWEYEFEQID